MEDNKDDFAVIHEEGKGVEKDEGTDSATGRDGCDAGGDARGLFAPPARPHVNKTPVQIQQI